MLIQSAAEGLGETLQHNPVAALAVLFGAGVLTSLTPCVYPMIPITAGVIGGTAGPEASRGRVATLTLVYAAGLALVYALAGLLAGLTGSLFGTVSASPWARLTMAALLAVFGLTMLGVITVRIPSGLLAWAGTREGGSAGGVFVLGATSGLVAAPCGAPAFAAVLAWVAATRSGWLGFVYLFVFSLGMTALLVGVGLFSGTLARLPRSGVWTLRVKHLGGVIMLVMSAWYLYRLWLSY